jgi:Phage major capsid protein E
MPPTISVPSEVLLTTATLIESFKSVPLAPQFLRDKLFPRIAEADTDQVVVESYRGLARLAPYCSKFSKGTAVPREVTQTSYFSPPFVKPIRNLTSDDLFYKSAAAASAHTDRDAELLVLDYAELDAAIGRTEEKMCADLLFSGTVVCRDGDTQEVVAELTYGTPTKTSPAKLWSDPASDPLGDIRGALRLVSSACGVSADLIVMGSAAADAFESNAQVQNAYNKLQVIPGILDPQTVAFGVTLLGSYRGLPIYCDETQYLDSTGAMKSYVPADNVLIAASSLAGTMAYGGIGQVDANETSFKVYAGRRIPVISFEVLEDFRKFRLSSRPVPVPQNLASWALLDVI